MGVQHDQRTFALPLGDRPMLTASALRFAQDEAPTYGVLDDVLAQRRKHWANGHTPAHDRHHGALFFTNAAQDFLRSAATARSPEKRRHWQIAAVAMLVALIDQEDFLTRQKEPANEAV